MKLCLVYTAVYNLAYAIIISVLELIVSKSITKIYCYLRLYIWWQMTYFAKELEEKKMVISAVWIHVCPCLTFAFCSSLFFFLFFLFFIRSAFRDKFYYSCIIHQCSHTVHVLFMHLKICLTSHGTIHTFKNYFATVFSIFSFSKNKLYPNRPIDWIMWQNN